MIPCCATVQEEVTFRDVDLQHEFQRRPPPNRPYDFQDIIDDKHLRYTTTYDDKQTTLFWGLGIENETYLRRNTLRAAKDFATLRQKRERYSVNYYNNFKEESLQRVIQKLKTQEKLTYPIYINSHTFQSTDPKGEHRTHYDVGSTPNPRFTESIHSILMRENEFYRSVYDKSVVFDGDSIEFITQDFHNTTVKKCVGELIEVKRRFQAEVSPFFERWGDGVQFPDHNYGLVSFLTTKQLNLGVCNNGTVHINMTLPTILENGLIQNKDQFAKEHLHVVRCIQMVEPLFIACYGTPDVFSLVDPAYSVGSLRISLSRYVSIQTFDTDQPINGKLLLTKKDEDPSYWQNQFQDAPYHMNPSIGYDINFNKFKNHGIEIRFFEWFPEEYLESVTNFFVLLAQHALELYKMGSFGLDRTRYQTILLGCVRKGFTYVLIPEECNIILKDLALPFVYEKMTAFALLHYINDILYDRYHDGPIVRLLSPDMEKPVLINYNFMAFQKLHRDVFGKPDLILRAEHNPLEERAPLTPEDLSKLRDDFTLLVETSTTRCYSDEEYCQVGATIVPAGYWATSRHSYVIGLKEIQVAAHPTQTLLHFAHCFKGQEEAPRALALLKGGTFIDYEYMLKEKKRVISFCGQSGKVGCYLALMAFYRKMPAFEEAVYREILDREEVKPKVLLIGYGTVGKACKAVMDQFGIECTIWTSKDRIDKEVIIAHDILINAIRLSDDPMMKSEPFLLLEDLTVPDRLSVICDISCDMGNPRNTLPIYTEYTSKIEPMRMITDTVSLIAINNLPSLEPAVSSQEFSSILVEYVPKLLHYTYSKAVDPQSAVLYGSYEKFLKVLRESA